MFRTSLFFGLLISVTTALAVEEAAHMIMNDNRQPLMSERCDHEHVCRPLEHCPTAMHELEFNIKPKICGWQNSTSPLICCKPSPLSKYRYVMSLLHNSTDCNFLSNVNSNPGELMRGAKAWAKCLEYQIGARFPCSPPTVEGEPVKVIDQCHNSGIRPIAGGGINAKPQEFSHMALLGYGENLTDVQWLCGGTLISERFIMTAGHCIATREGGDVTFIALGVLRRSDPFTPENIYRVKRIVRYPEYHPPKTYHDIALLETDREVLFSKKVVPACLHVGNEVSDRRARATGWGALGHKKKLADYLQVVPLWKVSDENCSSHYPPHRFFPRGYDNSTQMCYGDDGRPRDTCQGDSGGPLQIQSHDIYCMYLILGVTSFGSTHCAEVGSPGIYTRVSYYVPWIESVVWP